MAVDPIYLFISGGARAGKSHLIKIVYQTVSYEAGPSIPDVPAFLLLAPTGIAAVSYAVAVTNSASAIPIDVLGEHIDFLPCERVSRPSISCQIWN